MIGRAGTRMDSIEPGAGRNDESLVDEAAVFS